MQLENALLESRCTKGGHTGLHEKVGTLGSVRRCTLDSVRRGTLGPVRRAHWTLWTHRVLLSPILLS